MHKVPNIVITMGYRVFSSNLDEIELINSQSKLVNTISPNYYGISAKDKQFREALKNTDYLVYFALSSILQIGKNIRKNKEPDVFFHL